MDPTCRFATQYQGTGRLDPVVETHVRNCADCQGEVLFLDGALSWA